MTGKVCVITGATSGIGLAMAQRLARMGASLALVGRDRARGAAALADMKAIAPDGSYRLYLADLSRLAEMKRLAAELLEKEERIDVLINNAGAVFGHRRLTADGLESTFAVNHMAPFVVTNLMRGRLMQSAPSRIVTTSSAAHRSGRLDFDDLQSAHRYRAIKAYADSKLANILFTTELARRLEGTGVTANCFHPGVVSTRLGKGGAGMAGPFGLTLRLLGMTPEKGAETGLFLAANPAAAQTSGAYFDKCRAVPPRPQAQDAKAARRLWTQSARLARMEAYLSI
jgi:NAD(P)-dependent dehydrogenase (short-subunit alcohol dehydrogenase family)